MNIKVMSFNLRCVDDVEHRAPNLCECINKYRPDVLGVQEATPQWMALLSQGLADYGWIGVGRDGSALGEYSAVFYLNTRFTLLDTNTFWLSETPDIISKGWDAGLRRICTWAKLKDKSSGIEFFHFNTHLDHIGQLACVNGIALVADKLLEQGLPSILTGDFNQSEGSDTYNKLLDKGLRDTKYISGKSSAGGTFHDFGRSETVGKSPIDYIFVTPHFKALSYAIIDEKAHNGTFLSDHYGLLSEIALVI